MDRTAYEVEPVLRVVARTMQASLGFGTVVINLHRAAWDDFETVVVEGSAEARDALLGQTSGVEDWAPLLDPRFERRGAYLIEAGAYDWSQDTLTSWVPPLPGPPTPSDPGAWDPEDALFVPLRSAAGDILGILSVDEPADGRRPDEEKLDLIVGVAQHAALAVEHAQEAAAAERQRVAVDHLLRLTASLAERRTIDEMLEAVCVGIRDALGFEKVVVALRRDDAEVFALRATCGIDCRQRAARCRHAAGRDARHARCRHRPPFADGRPLRGADRPPARPVRRARGAHPRGGGAARPRRRAMEPIAELTAARSQAR